MSYANNVTIGAGIEELYTLAVIIRSDIRIYFIVHYYHD